LEGNPEQRKSGMREAKKQRNRGAGRKEEEETVR